MRTTFLGIVISLKLVHPLNQSPVLQSTVECITPVKYWNSLNVVIDVFPLNAVPILDTACNCDMVTPVPSPQLVAHILSTTGSANLIYLAPAVICKSGNLASSQSISSPYALLTYRLPLRLT
jgi:hypothetical protein